MAENEKGSASLTSEQARAEIVNRTCAILHTRMTPEFVELIRQPAYADWFQTLLTGVFDRIEGKTNTKKPALRA